ncbi:polysaccharide deacetylase family protein [Bordetella tumulicola]|uniref:polysaccharide deacetylase family protein n=1 Tax=Bordetella tumulicola TaxID=1649133 RepID=UPI0039EF7B56
MSLQAKLARCPVVIGVNVDTESLDAANAGKGGLFGRHSYGRYGAREGVWRMLDEFSHAGVHVTFFMVPEDAQRHLHIVDAVLKQGHEIAVRGKVQAEVGGASFLESLEQDRDMLQQITGHRPVGWRAANGLVTEKTLPALADLGYLYDSSAQDDDVPYVMRGLSGSTLVELPVFDYLTDATFYTHRHTDARVRKAWVEEADAQYNAGGYINLTLHTRGDVGSSRLPRVQIVGDFIRTMASRPDVEFYRAADLADAWREARTDTEAFPTRRAPQI